MSVDHLNRVLALIKPAKLAVYDRYYRGRQPIAFLPAEVRAQVGDRLPELVVNVPRVVVGAVEERLDVEGFRLARDEPADASLFDIWQGNDLDEWSQLCHIESLVHGISFVTVWAGDDEMPRIAVESATQMAVEYAPGTRVVRAAAKTWQEADDEGRPVTRAVLYLPDEVQHYSRPGSPMVEAFGSSWQLDDVVPNPLGEVPVVPFVNRPRLTDLTGESELADVMPLTDAINKLAVDMMVTSEFHAEPRRYATGLQVPRDAQGSERLRAEAKQQWQDAATGRILLGGPNVQFGQFAAADLQNFIGAIKLMLAKVSFVSGLPPHYLGVTTDNPASADAIRSAESSLIRKAKRKQRAFGGSWERVMRLALKVRDGAAPASALSMETIWANPETQTFAQDADAVQKLTGGDRPVLTVRAGRELLRLTPTQIARMESDERAAAANAATADVDARVQMARRLMAEDGLSQTAAFAAVGLLAAAGAMNGTPPAPPGGPSATV